MANLTSVLKEEITRLARKEIKSETEALKKAASQYRSEIADLKRRAVALEKQLSKLGKEVSKNTPPKEKVDPSKIRFIAKGFKSMREKLGITAKEMSVLLDISAPTIYNWEAGISKPKQPQLIRIAHLRTMGKQDVADVLTQLATPAPKAKSVINRQSSKTAPKVAAKPAPKVVVKEKAKTVVKQTVAKTVPPSAPKGKTPRVITKSVEPVIQPAPKASRKPRTPKPEQAPVAELVDALTPISTPISEPTPKPEAEI